MIGRLPTRGRLALAGFVSALAAGDAGPLRAQSTPWYAEIPTELAWLDRSAGLSHNSTFVVLQDHQGYLWIGTIDGLNRYDGSSFEIFRHDPSDPTSLSNSSIRKIEEDSRGRLWIRTGSGVDRYDRSTGSFRRYAPTAQQVLEDSEGTIWACALDGVYRYDEDADRFELVADFETAGGLDGDPPWGLLEQRDGSLWVVTNRGRLLSYAKDGGLLGDRQLPWDGTHFNEQSADGRTWVSHSAGLGMIGPDFERQSGTVDELPPIPAQARPLLAAYRDRAGRVWIGGSGLFRWTPGSAGFEAVWADTDRGGLDPVWNIEEDREGTIWASTLRGVLRFDAYVHRFGHTRSALASDGRDVGPTMAIDEAPDGTIWVGTLRTGLFTIDPDEPAFARGPAVIGVRDVWDIHRAFGSTWLGTTNGLFEIPDDDPIARPVALGRFEPATRRPGTSRAQPIVFTIANAGGRLWVGGSAGLWWLDPETREVGEIERVQTDRASPINVEALRVRDDGRVWALTRASDVYAIDPRTLETTFIRTGDPVAFRGSEGPWATAIDGRGRMWTGGDRGLALLDEGNAALRVIGPRDGFPGSTVYAIVPDDEGAFWISASAGLFRLADPTRFPEAPLELRLYRLGTDVPESEFNRRAALRTETGALMFGGTSGLTYFHPADILDNPFAPLVSIDRVERITERGAVPVFAFAKDEIEIPREDAGIDVFFAAPRFASAENVRYSVMLEGSDPDWFDPGPEPRVRYMGVGPGAYTFRARAMSPDGVWSETDATLRIVIPPPFWATAWFRILAGLLVLTTLIGSVRAISTRRLREQLRGLELERSIQQERDRISRDLHDHVGSQVSGLLSGIELARLGTAAGESEEVATYLEDLDNDARRALTELRETVWSLHQEQVTVAIFGERVEDYLERRQRFLRTPSLSLRTSGDLGRVLTPAQALNLFRIVQEAISNAVRHAEAEHVVVTVDSAAEALRIRVEDDGAFRRESPRAGTGLGVEGMRARMTEIGGTFAIDGDECGTTVDVRL
ncbi:MAG: histidine kinase [Gemmatimonadetes bacterium]|nr:histidine kinase [Gemmatimonadota bacterium]